MTRSIEIKVLEGVDQVAQSAWDALVGDESPFLEWAFLSALERTGCVGGDTGWIPQIITAWESGTLIGAVPFYLKLHSQGEFIFDWGWAEAAERSGIRYYPKGLVAVPFTPVTGARLLVHSGQSDPKALKEVLVEATLTIAKELGLSSVHFNFTHENDALILDEKGLPVRKSVQYHWYNEDFRTFDDFLAVFRSKRRANMRRERRLLADRGVTTRVITGSAITHSDIKRAFRYYARTVDKFYYGRRYLNDAFFEELQSTFADRIHLLVAEQEGTAYAGAFNLLKGDRLYGRYWGCRREEEFTHFEVCMYAPIEWCIQNQIQVFEPGAGGEHKFERGFRATTMLSAHWIANPGLRAAIEDFVTREAEHVDQQVEWMDARGPFKRDD